jgi:uncharacterized integral membrane protein
MSEDIRQARVGRAWISWGTLVVGLVLMVSTTYFGVAEGITSDVEHRAGVLEWPVVVGFIVGLALTAVGTVALFAAYAKRRTT